MDHVLELSFAVAMQGKIIAAFAHRAHAEIFRKAMLELGHMDMELFGLDYGK
jgi:hypothetical protein